MKFILLALSPRHLMHSPLFRRASQWTVALARATRWVISVAAARLVLLEAVAQTPDAATLHYHLARYECALGDHPAAKVRLARAIDLEPKYRKKALEEEDLAPLWQE